MCNFLKRASCIILLNAMAAKSGARRGLINTLTSELCNLTLELSAYNELTKGCATFIGQMNTIVTNTKSIHQYKHTIDLVMKSTNNDDLCGTAGLNSALKLLS
jgi:hypothetical protein